MEPLPIELELRKLGLNEKEVKVYLAGLKLGPTSVNNIAKAADITRPTAYEIIEKLEKKDLFAKIREDKKSYYMAQSPDNILGILRIKKKEIEEKEREFVRIIAALEAKYSDNESDIKRYKGKEGIDILLGEALAFTQSEQIFVMSSGETSELVKKRKEVYKKIKNRLGEIEVKEICDKERKGSKSPKGLECKVSPFLDIKGTLIIFDKVIFLYPKEQKGFLIESRIIMELLRSLFLTIWEII